MAEIVPGRATGGPIEDFTQTRKREEEAALRKKQQEDEAKRKAAAEAERQRKAKLGSTMVNPVKPVQGIVQALTGTGASPKRPKYQNQLLQQAQENILEPIGRFTDESKRTLVKGVVGVAEGVLNVGTQAVMDLTVNRNKEKDEYLRAAYDFGVTPKTELGKAGATILGFIIGTRAASKALGPIGKLGTSPVPSNLKGGAKVAAQAKRLVTEGLIPGAVADFILTDPREGNISNAIQNLVPEQYRDNVAFALAAKEDDNPWINRLRSTFEGGPLNAAGNGIAALIFGNKAARAVKAAGGSDEEALAAGIRAASDKSDELMKADVDAQELERVRWTDAQEKEMLNLQSREASINERLTGLDPEDDVGKALTEELDRVRLAQADLENTIFEGADPNVKYESWESQAAIRTDPDINNVAAKQIELEGGYTRPQSETGFVPGRQISHGASGKVFTDAQLRIMNLDEGAEAIIKKYSKQVDIKQIARKAGRTVDQVVADATRIYTDFMDSLKSHDDLLNESDLLKKLSEIGGTLTEAKGVFPTPEGNIAVKAITSDLANQIYDIAYRAEDLDVSQVGNFNNFDRIIDRFTGLLEIYKAGAQYQGGGLNAYKIKIGADTPGEAAEALREFETEDSLSIRQIRKWAGDIKEAFRRGDVDAQDQLRALTRAMVLAGGDPSKTISFGRTAIEIFGKNQMGVFYNSILSGTKTMIRNLSAVYRLVEAPTSIALMGMRKGDPALVRSAMAGFHAITTSTQEAFTVAARTWSTGMPQTWTPKMVVEQAEMAAMIESMEKMAKNPKEEMVVGFLKGHMRIAQWFDFPSKILMSTDDALKTVLVRQRIAEQAMYKAMTESKDPMDVAGKVKAYMAEYSKSIDPQTGKVKDAGLQHYAEIGTFQEDPGIGINSLSMFLENMPFVGPLGKLVVPFLRTPANIIRYQVQHTPMVGRYAGEYLAVKQSGDMLRMAEYEGREMIGAMTIAVGAGLAASELITGNMPSDPRERNRWKTLDIRPRSIKIGDRWVSYNTIEPLSNILAASADIVMLAKTGLNEDWVENLVGQLGLSIAASLTEKSYFAGLEALAAIADPTQLMKGDTVLKGLLQTGNNMVPLAGTRRAFANSLDPYMREFDNEFQRAAAAAIPGVSTFFPEKINVLTGKPLNSPNGGPWNALVPFETSPDNKDPVAKMLMETEFNWSDTLETSPTGYRLSGDEKSYIRMEMSQNGLRPQLDELRKLDWFKRDLANWKQRSIGDIGTDRRQWPRFYTAIQDIWESSRTRAFDKMESEKIETGQKLIKVRQAQSNIGAGQYDLSKPLSAEDFSTADEAGATQVYNELIKFGNPK
jgi:hypothetical protein